MIFILSACAGSQNNRDYNYLRMDKRAMSQMETAIDKCQRRIEENKKSKPDSLVLSDTYIKFKRYVERAKKSDPKILKYSKLYRGQTYQQWVVNCENKHFK